MSPPNDLDFERIARQAREFREQEEQRIAAEKKEEARRIAVEKEAELERIAQAHEQTLEEQQEQLDAENNSDVHDHSSSSHDSKSSKPSPGTVARRAEWLRKLEKDAAARRALEEEFNALLAARRKNNPNEAIAESEAAVKAALWSSSSSDDSHHSHSLHSVVEEDEEHCIAGRLRFAESRLYVDIGTEMKKIQAEIVEKEDKNENQIFNEAILSKDCDVKSFDFEVNNNFSSDSNTMESTMHEETIAEEKVSVPCPEIALQRNPIEIKRQHPKEKSVEATADYGFEANPKTQAMVAEDDIISRGNDREEDVSNTPLRSGISDFNQDGNKRTLVVENFIPVDRKKGGRSKGASRNILDDGDDSRSEMIYKEASFEVPVEVSENGLVLSLDDADLNMITTIPPSHFGGRISGRLEGRSKLGRKGNTATGSASVEWKASKHSRLTLGMIRGCEPHHPLITIGGQLFRHGSSIGVTFYHNAKFLHQMMLEHSLWSLSFRHCFPNSKWCLSSQLSRRQDLSLSLKNGNKLSGLIGWNLLKPKQFRARIDVRPRISAYRRAHLYCQWQSLYDTSVWNFGVSLVQNLHSQIATIGLGWRLFSTRGLEWVISWSRGNATIRIPIVVSKGLAVNATIGHSLYFSVVSYLIQDYIAEVWGWIGNADDDDGESATYERLLAIRAQSLTKARRDAVIQKELMSRQALRKTKDEKERDGLVINKAIYKIDDGEEWDVTVPLQFWVTRSTLVLTSRPKRELLGFYDIAASQKHSKEISSARERRNSQTRVRKFPSWSDIWCDLLGRTPKDKILCNEIGLPSPTLSVFYEYKSQPYEITVEDCEELRLPAV